MPCRQTHNACSSSWLVCKYSACVLHLTAAAPVQATRLEAAEQASLDSTPALMGRTAAQLCCPWQHSAGSETDNGVPHVQTSLKVLLCMQTHIQADQGPGEGSKGGTPVLQKPSLIYTNLKAP